MYISFLSCIPIKKYGVVSLGMEIDRLTACSWCGAKWVKLPDGMSELVFLVKFVHACPAEHENLLLTWNA